jgi:N-glycosylase/DNA lyase
LLYHNIISLHNKIKLKDSLFSGQSFSWNISNDRPDYYACIIKYQPVLISQLSDTEIIVYSNSTTINDTPISDFISNYFSIDIDVNRIFRAGFYEKYPSISELVSGYLSVRILRQEFFETMITFMCAQGIGMHLIRKQVNMIARTYGDKVSVAFNGTPIDLYTFPEPYKLAEADLFELSRCTNNNRIRAANISLAARAVADGVINSDTLSNPHLPLSELRSLLCQNPGIGFKIADCIALFGLGRFDAFPIDTHVKQYLAHWFNSSTALKSLTPSVYLELDGEARAILGSEMAGYAGHLLFHCWRKEIKKLRTF